MNGESHPPIATHMLAIMVRGVFFKLEFPIAHFGTDKLNAASLFPIVWEAVRHWKKKGSLKNAGALRLQIP